MVAVEALEYGGFDVIQAATGEEALQHCRDAIADILFTDIRLPGTVTGGDIAEHCRERKPDLSVIYATGYTHVEPRPVPGSLLFQKPYHPAQVVTAIRSLGHN
jgi:CheY-like chemotaxis protein